MCREGEPASVWKFCGITVRGPFGNFPRRVLCVISDPMFSSYSTKLRFYNFWNVCDQWNYRKSWLFRHWDSVWGKSINEWYKRRNMIALWGPPAVAFCGKPCVVNVDLVKAYHAMAKKCCEAEPNSHHTTADSIGLLDDASWFREYRAKSVWDLISISYICHPTLPTPPPPPPRRHSSFSVVELHMINGTCGSELIMLGVGTGFRA